MCSFSSFFFSTPFFLLTSFLPSPFFSPSLPSPSTDSWFSWPEIFDDLPIGLQYATLFIAAAHFYYFGLFCVRNLFLCLRNIDYSEAELANAFMQWRWKEAVFSTIIDLQLAFVQGVQEQLRDVQEDGDSFSVYRNLVYQLWILLKFHGSPPNPEYLTEAEEKGEKEGTEKQPATPANYKGKTVKQLREMCEQQGIEHRDIKLKKYIIAALEE